MEVCRNCTDFEWVKSEQTYGDPLGFQSKRSSKVVWFCIVPWTVSHSNINQGQPFLASKIWWDRGSLGYPGLGKNTLHKTNTWEGNYLTSYDFEQFLRRLIKSFISKDTLCKKCFEISDPVPSNFLFMLTLYPSSVLISLRRILALWNFNKFLLFRTLCSNKLWK